MITQGGFGTNEKGLYYNIPGLGFAKSEKLVYLTELQMSASFNFYSVAAASINLAEMVDPTNPNIKQTVRDAWAAVGVIPAYTTNNSPVFLTNDFTSISIGKDNCLWAGTYQKGLYKLNGTNWQQARGSAEPTWQRVDELANNFIYDIKTDKAGGIWIAQAGYNGFSAIDGGLEYYPDSSFTTRIHYGAVHGLPTRNVRSVFLDTTRTSTGNMPVVWTANVYNITGGTYTNGGVGKGLNAGSPAFTTIRTGVETTYGTGYCQTVGGNAMEIWVYAFNNFNRSQILRYNAVTNAFLGFYDSTNVSNIYLSKNFQAKSIYFDSRNRRWLGMLKKGLVVQDSSLNWHAISLPSIFNDTTFVNNNAITGDKNGNIFIGTNRGLLVYNNGNIDSASSYKFYGQSNDYLSSNIRGMVIDTAHNRLIMATADGIANYSCPGCLIAPLTANAKGTGLWSDPNTWDNNRIPDENTNVVVAYPVTVDINARCKSLKAKAPGIVTVQSGKTLKIENSSASSVID